MGARGSQTVESIGGEPTVSHLRGGYIALPKHVAIIMDGNGRWAAAKGLPRFEGHRRGLEALRRAVRSAVEIGIEYLTIYSFSSENWSRPQTEVLELMGLLKHFIRHDLADLHSRNICVKVIGERDDLSKDIVCLLDEAEQLTRLNNGMKLIVAFNYGGRQEIARATRRLVEAISDGKVDAARIDADTISTFLDTAAFPDPDLVIRTSGEQRLSNFLIWQSAYAEFVFLPVLWPDFDRAQFEIAIEQYRNRERRFGGLKALDAGGGRALG